MKVFVFTFLLIAFTTNIFWAQEKYLILSYGCPGFQKSFTKVTVIDNRKENKILGFVKVGLFDRLAAVVFNGNLTLSLAKFFRTKDIIAKPDKELFVILNDLYVSQIKDLIGETGRLKITMRLFFKGDQYHYRELFTVDSAYFVTGIDVSNKLLKSVSQHVCEISKQAGESTLTDNRNSPNYTLDELYSLDSIEKIKLPMYMTDSPNSGIYIDFNHFKMNSPDSSIVTIDSSIPGKMKVYKWDSVKKENVKIENDSIYAVYDGKTLLKATSIGFYRMIKTGLDFYYYGHTSFTYSKDPDLFWTFMFGITGAVISYALDIDDHLFKFKINYLKGNSIPVSIPKK